MTTPLERYTTVCSFYDEYFNKTNAFYEVRIDVINRIHESGVEYYDIGYTYKFHKEELIDPDDILYYRKIIHPFHNEDPESKRGDIVRKNKMTTTMIEFLLMSDEALASEIGPTTAQRYRQDIMLSLAKFWD